MMLIKALMLLLVVLQGAHGVEKKYIVKHHESTRRGAVPSLNGLVLPAGTGIQHNRRMSLGRWTLTVSGNSEADVDEAKRRLERLPSVEYVVDDAIVTPSYVPNDPRYGALWSLRNTAVGINAEQAWDRYPRTRGEGVVVAVVDTGIINHPDLDANVLPGYDFISDPVTARDGDGRDNNPRDEGDWAAAGDCYPSSPAAESSWHGTHVAGTIAAEDNNEGIIGVAFRAEFVPVRVLGWCGGLTSDLLDGVLWAAGGTVAGVPQNQNPAQVINLSLGARNTPCNQAWRDTLREVQRMGSFVVAAAGNNGVDASTSSPAGCREAFTVAATDIGGNRAWYSNFGNIVDLAAPGGETATATQGILSTVNTGTQGPVNNGHGYEYYQGTSMAAPHVSGIAALLFSMAPNMSPRLAADTLLRAVKAFSGTCSGCGAGLVDARMALGSLLGSGGRCEREGGRVPLAGCIAPRHCIVDDGDDDPSSFCRYPSGTAAPFGSCQSPSGAVNRRCPAGYECSTRRDAGRGTCRRIFVGPGDVCISGNGHRRGFCTSGYVCVQEDSDDDPVSFCERAIPPGGVCRTENGRKLGECTPGYTCKDDQDDDDDPVGLCQL